MKDELALLVQLLLSEHHISVDKDELSFQIQSHPSYPSLHAITGVLDHFNIDNIALDVPVNEATLSQLPITFLAQLKTADGEAFGIATKKGSDYEVVLSEKDKKKVSIETFLNEFTGILVAVEKTEDITVSQTKRASKYTILSIVSLIIVAAILVSAKIELVSLAYFLLSLLGIYISYAVVKQELGESSLLGNAFCPSNSSQNNCNKVLTSKGAQFGSFKLSDLSMSYFIGITLATFLMLLTNSSISLLYVISILTIPINLYSVYYQYAVVKQWCLLCLSIVGVICVQAALSLFHADVIADFLSNGNPNSLLVVALSFVSVFVIWNLSSTRSRQVKELTISKIKYFKFKRDYKLFETILNSSKVIDTTMPNTSEIVFGNKEAKLDITIITSPFCGHCKAVHTLVEDILKKHSELVKLTIRFNANAPNTALVDITSRLLELYHTDGETHCLAAMHDIYGDLDTEAWTSKWGTTASRGVYEQTLADQHEWCIGNDINFTPELLINGQSYPKMYDRGDLIFFIEDLEENCCITQERTTVGTEEVITYS